MTRTESRHGKMNQRRRGVPEGWRRVVAWERNNAMSRRLATDLGSLFSLGKMFLTSHEFYSEAKRRVASLDDESSLIAVLRAEQWSLVISFNLIPFLRGILYKPL